MKQTPCLAAYHAAVDGGRLEIRSLTGLRGLAALLVVPVHATPLGAARDFTHVFFWHGYLWVDLFLALSGFVLARSYDGRFRAQPLLSATASFLRRRLVRIWPLFAVTTCCELAATQYGLTWFDGPAVGWGWLLAANLLMVQAWVGLRSIDVPGWSVSGEWACCVAFPALRAVLFGRAAWPAAAAFVAAAAALALMAASPLPARRGALDLGFSDTPFPGMLFPVGRCLASFVMGMAMWRAGGHPAWRVLARVPGMDLALGAAILLLMGWENGDLAVVLLFPPFVLSLSFERGMLARVLGARPIHAIGVISYSIYLLQAPLVVLQAQSALLAAAQRALAPFLQGAMGNLALFYALLLPCAALTWLVIERPGRRLLRR